jgi:hypothetical protein
VTKNTLTPSTNVVASAANIAYAGITNTLLGVAVVSLVAGDWISCNVFQNSGGALNFASVIGDEYFILQRLSS